ncbi:MAG: hypothetical protein M3N32_09735 [Actinomycetota bacterium]|nr:hypothetical protein [Actinomycetota bacterium]
MANLVVTGPPILGFKWDQLSREEETGFARDFYPESRHQEARGYFHGGLAAAALLDAARILFGPPANPTSVSVELRRLVPLGHDLRMSVTQTGETAFRGTLLHLHHPGWKADPVDIPVVGETRFAGPEPAPDIADIRELALVPVPVPQEHELFAGCFVCGQDNTSGLQLLPGWHADGRVVVSFHADERYTEADRKGELSPLAVCALLSCPTLWANKHVLDETDQAGALLTDYAVRFHAGVQVGTNLRTIGIAGEPDAENLRGVSALVDNRGELFATASATWRIVDEMPAREPGGAAPPSEEMPLKGGRPEARSPGDWGQPLPGRREDAGPRSERPDGSGS